MKPFLSPWESAQGVLEAVAEICQIEVEGLFRHDRVRTHERARMLAMYIMRETMSFSLREIGNVFDRDHSTVLSACRRIRLELRRDVLLVELLARVLARLGPGS